MKTHPKKFIYYIAPFILVVPLTFTLFTIATSSYTSIQTQHMVRLTNELWNRLNQDLKYLDVQGDEVANQLSLQEHIAANDYEAILSTLVTEKQRRNIGLMGIADANGYIITRTKSITSIGENAFTESPQGRALTAMVPNVASIEVSSFDDSQVLMTTARFVVSNEQKIGALFANYLLDDAYAANLAAANLSPITANAQVAFYTDSKGIFGSSFSSESDRLAVDEYFLPTILATADQIDLITLGNTTYRFQKIPIDGLEGQHTGAIIFVPVVTDSKLALYTFIVALGIAFLSSLIVKLRY